MIDVILAELNSLKFPYVSDGDTIKFHHLWFIYQNDSWILDEQKNTNILSELEAHKDITVTE